jgi:photosystem II stability/assembly factor-like uncharacterized protein
MANMHKAFMFGNMRGHAARFAVGSLTLAVGIAVALFVSPRESKHETAPTQPRVEVRSEQKAVQLVPLVPRYKYASHGIMNVALLENGDMWGAGYDGNDPRRLFLSKDGGRSWERREVRTKKAFTLIDIDFVDTQRGWAVGGYGTILRTTDGGGTWEQVERPTDADLHEVHFVNSKIGYVAGRNAIRTGYTDEVTGSLEILRTEDGGESWRRCYTENTPGSVFRIASFGERIAVAAINGNRLIRTEDAGRTWKRVGESIAGVMSVAFDHNGVGWAVGHKWGFYRSLDKGKTWEMPRDLPPGILGRWWEDIDFLNSETGLAVGERGALAVTRDGGSTWTDESVGGSERFGVVHLRGSGGLILGSENVYRLVIE